MKSLFENYLHLITIKTYNYAKSKFMYNNGNVHFMEPMITTAFLLGGTMITKSIPQATLFSPANKYYPGSYTIWKDAINRRHYVALTDFTWK